ncbi:MAG: hypothetical protein ACYTF0_09560, partial [Planctomycetota bacterium]
MMSELLVDVVMGGPGHEAAVSRASGAAVVAALQAAGCDARALEVDDVLDVTRLRAGAVVFNVIHGTYGEDGTLQGELDAAGIAYVGTGAAGSRLCIDKQATKERLAANALPVPWGMVVNPDQGAADPKKLRTPTLTGLVVKPARDGSSVGLRLLSSPSFLLPTLEELFVELGPVPLLVEERLTGSEYTVAIIDDDNGQVRPFAPIEVVPAAGAYDYEAKYQRDDTRYQPVADDALAAELVDLAVRAYRVCGCRDLARVDLMAAADGSLRILELNTLPGCTDHSLLPKAAAAGAAWGRSAMSANDDDPQDLIAAAKAKKPAATSPATAGRSSAGKSLLKAAKAQSVKAQSASPKAKAAKPQSAPPKAKAAKPQSASAKAKLPKPGLAAAQSLADDGAAEPGLVTVGVGAALSGVDGSWRGLRRVGPWLALLLTLLVAGAVLVWQAWQVAPGRGRLHHLRITAVDGATLPDVLQYDWLKAFGPARAQALARTPSGERLAQLRDHLQSRPSVAGVLAVRIVAEGDVEPVPVCVVELRLRRPVMPVMLANGERAWVDDEGLVISPLLTGPREPILRGYERAGWPALQEVLDLWPELKSRLPADFIKEIVLDEVLDEVTAARGIVLHAAGGTRVVWGVPGEGERYGVSVA